MHLATQTAYAAEAVTTPELESLVIDTHEPPQLRFVDAPNTKNRFPPSFPISRLGMHLSANL